MKIRTVDSFKTADEAREYAIDWQVWQAEQNLSWGEAAEWFGLFAELAEKFNLTEEWQEEGII